MRVLTTHKVLSYQHYSDTSYISSRCLCIALLRRARWGGFGVLPTGYSNQQLANYDLSRSYEATGCTTRAFSSLCQYDLLKLPSNAFQHLQICFSRLRRLIQPQRIYKRAIQLIPMYQIVILQQQEQMFLIAHLPLQSNLCLNL